MSISPTRAFGVAALALAGCNALFGLDPVANDRDGDGIADSDDNCPLDPNAMQRDSDANGLGDVCDCVLSGADGDHDGIDDACDDCLGDGPTGIDSGGDGIDDGCELCPAGRGVDLDGDHVDDACDPCPLGSPHDEDIDGVADACDNCPVLANPDQRETDGDALGDACDHPGVTMVRSRFDGFAERDQAVWLGAVPTWEWTADGLAASATSERFSTYRLDKLLQVDALVPIVPGEVSSLRVRGGLTARCQVDGNRGITLEVNGGPSDFFDADGPVPGTGPIHLRLLSTDLQVTCAAIDSADGVILQSETFAPEPVGGRVSIAVEGAGRFEYLWVLDNP